MKSVLLFSVADTVPTLRILCVIFSTESNLKITVKNGTTAGLEPGTFLLRVVILQNEG